MKCVKCKKSNFLGLLSKACDGNYYWWGDNEDSGYMPTFSSITRGDGCNFEICIECGWIRGLDLKKLKKDVIKAFNEQSSQTFDSDNANESDGD
jgi:hypothetical protein